jgi:lipopolysaccharide transport system ATP-binding protein
MSNTVISVENVSKQYHLGTIGTGTFRNDLKLWWAKARNKPNPLALVDEADHGNRDGEILWALKDVSFKVEQGEALGIIGRNGAGKSTLLKILSRVTTPTSGEVKVKGRIASLLEVGTGFHPELTGRENIFLNGAIMGMSRAEVARKFDEIVDFSGVEKFIDTPVKRYSSGMYVRLAFAVAAHLEPEILIVDEVLAVGDAEFQKKCLGKMGDVAHEGRTVLFVSHNMSAIKNLCKNGILLEKGNIILTSTINKIINQYAETFSFESLIRPPEQNVGKAIFINNIKILSINNKETKTINFHEPFKIELDIISTKECTAIIGLGILDRYEQMLTTIHTLELYEEESFKTKQLMSFSKGKNKLILTIGDNILRPGRYFINCSIFSRQLHTTFDYFDHSIAFEIASYNNNQNFDDTQAGIFFCRNTNWQKG